MNLEKAAQALVKCRYARQFWVNHGNIYVIIEGTSAPERVDPLNNEAQRQALLEWFKVEVGWSQWEGEQPDYWFAYTFDSDKGEYREEHICETRIEAENSCLQEILK